MTPQNDPVLKHFRAELHKLYGDRLERVVLFGSRARGDERVDSDYDVAIFIKNYTSFWNELGVLAPIIVDLGLHMDAFISAKPFPDGTYNNRTPLMHEIRREGVEV